MARLGNWRQRGHLPVRAPFARAVGPLIFPPRTDPACEVFMSHPVERSLELMIFNSRWLLAPFFFGLVLSIVLLLLKFLQELWHLVVDIMALDHGVVVTEILTL